MATQGAGQQLSLHSIGVRDEDTNSIRRGGGDQTGQAALLEIKEKRCRDFRDRNQRPQGTSSQNCGTAFKMGILISHRENLVMEWLPLWKAGTHAQLRFVHGSGKVALAGLFAVKPKLGFVRRPRILKTFGFILVTR